MTATGNPAASDPASTGRIAVERVAETHFMLRPSLVNQLQKQLLTPQGQALKNTAAVSYADYWTETFGDRFFDMGTFIRLGSAIEQGLRHYYQDVAGKKYRDELIFQRLVNPSGLIKLFKADCGYDLQQNSHFDQMREAMVHRHLFAHRSGLVNQRYVDDLKKVTGEDIEPQLIANGYPSQDVYWFKPLKRLSSDEQSTSLIESARGFFQELSTSNVP